jgi:hypothetical protein
MVLRSLGVRVLNYLASDILDWCIAHGIELPSENDIEKYIGPLKEFDFKRKSSKIAAFGGEKGVREAYKLLLEFLGEHGIQEAKKKLEGISKS